MKLVDAFVPANNESGKDLEIVLIFDDGVKVALPADRLQFIREWLAKKHP